MALTQQQEKWFASVKANLETETGKTLAEWVELARQCPETKHRARLAWMKETYGLGQNRGSVVLAQAFPKAMNWDDETGLVEGLWTDPASRAIYEAVAARATRLPDVLVGPRKTFTAFSRRVQFAAIKPLKGGAALLGLDVAPEEDPRLAPARKESWSERLKSTLRLETLADVDERVAALIQRSWERAQ
jgi:hypothetical protein